LANAQFNPPSTLPPGGGRVRGIICAVLLVFGIMGTLGAGSMKGEKGEVQLTGRIYIMGNEPFTQVALERDDGQVYALTGEKERELRAFQGKRLIVTGITRGKTAQGVDAIEVKSYEIQKTE
jgi:hypothetical protein